MLWILIAMWVLAPAFAAWGQRRADKQAERLSEEALIELREGRQPRAAPPQRKLQLWPYALLALALTILWAVSQPISMGAAIGAAILVWIPFHIFIFVKRTSTGMSLLLLIVMLAAAAGVVTALQDPNIAHAVQIIR